MEVLSRAAGRGYSQGTSFSLAWDTSGDVNEERAYGRRAPPIQQQALSKESYAAALREQISAKRSLGTGYGDAPRRSNSFTAAANLNLGSELRSASRDVGEARANSYAQDLKAQIDERAAVRAQARNSRIAADREDDVRVERETSMFREQVRREQDVQAERHRVVQARADALERFLDARGEVPKAGAAAREGGALPPPAPVRHRVQFQDPVPSRGNSGGAAPIGYGGCGVLPGQNALPAGPTSANRFASGGNQNCGNVLTNKPTSRVLAPPGGRSSFSLAW